MCYTWYMSQFFFYDLETSGLNARQDRIMQFAGQRTTMDMTPVGEPYNLLIKLSDDTLPSPDALMVTGITPQKTVEEGYIEAEFVQILRGEICTPGTIMVGFNNVRFDDEFVRHLLWRNFCDPYEWTWKDGRSRWDLLDVVRMTRALRPEGIEWPVDEKGEPTNRLELITRANGIMHEQAHDALSDVRALIDVAALIKKRQPQLFEYLLRMRDKKAVQQLVNLDDKKPFVYTSGRHDKQWGKTTVAFPLASAPHGNVVVYDLRYDPTLFIDLSEQELTARLLATWEERQADNFVPVPVKQLQYNRCPAVAPLGVLEQADGWAAIGIDAATVKKHQDILLAHPDFAERIRTAYGQRPALPAARDPEARLYDGFVSDGDKLHIEAVRAADAGALADFHPEFQDDRLPELLLHYKARYAPQSLSEAEQEAWEAWRGQRIAEQTPPFLSSIQRLAASGTADQFIMDELLLWFESVQPDTD